jgi:hypothetical protein
MFEAAAILCVVLLLAIERRIHEYTVRRGKSKSRQQPGFPNRGRRRE